ncbi:MAG: hypothetical protein F9K18_07260, partial [Thermoanaerobaculia bacterium]
MTRRVLALTQGDPAGIGPETLLRALAASGAEVTPGGAAPVLIGERVAFEAVLALVPGFDRGRLVEVASPTRTALEALPA